MFKRHANFEKIKFIVDPDVKEHLCSPCDIPEPVEPLIAEFDKLFPQGLDMTLLDELCAKTPDFRNLWFLEHIETEWRDKLREAIVKATDVSKGNEYAHVCLDTMKELGYEEGDDNKRKRIARFVGRARDLSNQVTTDGSKSQVVLVGHSMMICELTAMYIKNCAIICVDEWTF